MPGAYYTAGPGGTRLKGPQRRTRSEPETIRGNQRPRRPANYPWESEGMLTPPDSLLHGFRCVDEKGEVQWDGTPIRVPTNIALSERGEIYISNLTPR